MEAPSPNDEKKRMSITNIKHEFHFKKRGLQPEEFDECLTYKMNSFMEDGQLTKSDKAKKYLAISCVKKLAIRQTRSGNLDKRKLKANRHYEQKNVLPKNESPQRAEQNTQSGKPLRQGETKFSKKTHKFYKSRQRKVEKQLTEMFPANRDKCSQSCSNAENFCNKIDYYTQMIITKNFKEIEDKEVMYEIYEECELLVMGRIAIDWAKENDLMDQDGWETWREHVCVLISFAAMLIALLIGFFKAKLLTGKNVKNIAGIGDILKAMRSSGVASNNATEAVKDIPQSSKNKAQVSTKKSKNVRGKGVKDEQKVTTEDSEEKKRNQATAMTMNTSTTVTVVNTDVSTTGSVVTSTAVTGTSLGTSVDTTTSTSGDVQSTSVPGSGTGSVAKSDTPATTMTMNTSATVTVVNTDVSTTGSVVTSTAVTATSLGTTVVTETSTPASVQSTSVPGSGTGTGSVAESENDDDTYWEFSDVEYEFYCDYYYDCDDYYDYDEIADDDLTDDEYVSSDEEQDNY